MTNKLKGLSIALVLLGAIGFGIYTIQQPVPKQEQKKLTKQQRIDEAIKDNFERTKDPKLGYPPVERLVQALEETRELQKESALLKNRFSNARFRERGPNNIAGRTRTILVDKRDPTGQTVFVGGVTGGLWKTTNISSTDPQWKAVDNYLESIKVGSLVQDPNDLEVMYMGTGEIYTGLFVGAGIYKSIDGGESFDLLPSTRVTGRAGDFNYIQDLYMDENSHLYAATGSGLRMSKDGGNTWDNLISGRIHEIQRSGDNLIVAAQSALYRANINDLNWENIVRNVGLPPNVGRIEIDVCKSNPNTIYLLGAQGGSATNIFATFDGGDNWSRLGIPQSVEGLANFTRGQANYDLVMAVDPFDCDHIIVGGIDPYESRNRGVTWRQIGHWFGGFGLQYIHADQHITVFDEDREGTVYIGNDGGIWRSVDNAVTFRNRNLGYNVTQFYGGAINPRAFSNQIIGGTQDNGSLLTDAFEIGNAREVQGGDGFLAHIDQDEPQYQLVSSQFGNWGLSTNEGKTFGSGISVNGGFLTPSDYDNETNLFYTQTNDGDFYRWQVPSGPLELIDIANVNSQPSYIYVDPSTDNRVYFGQFGNGEIFRVDNADKGTTVQSERLKVPAFGTISSIVVEDDNPDHLLVTLSNFGLSNNVYESKDGGATWIGIEGNLPDMPVHSCLFAPDNPQQALIATEIGVWFTELLDGANTVWTPPSVGEGTPLVRSSMLQIRESDNIVLAATYGRGMFTTDIFTEPAIVYDVSRVGYLNAPIRFIGGFSYGARSFLWNFGDGETDTLGNTVHSYDQIGEYDVSFTLNNDLRESTSIKILPDKTTPYTTKTDNYSGGFENNPEDWGVHTISGSGFERGNSTQRGKDGTFSGDNAFVVGLDEEFYQPNSHSILYMPNFDFSEPGLYEFSFWYKAFLQDGFDGFLVEYSIDKGITWNVLGQEQQNWYTFTNDNGLQGAAFENGTPYFARSRRDFEQAYVDVSSLAGQKDVAFRFVFKSNDSGSHPGVVIDDVEVTRFEGALQTDIVNLSAEYSSSEEAVVSFTTQPEYFAQRFILERSFNGRDYEEVAKIDPKGVVTARVQNYEVPTQGIRDLYFFRIRSINENKSDEYFYEFTTPSVVVSRGFEEVEVFTTFPNPFTDFIEMTFTDVVSEPLEVELYDAAGKLVYKNSLAVDNVYTRIDVPGLPAGVYFLSYKVGDRVAKTVRLLKNE